MNNKTKKLLRLCKKAGYTRVAIGVHDPRNAKCKTRPFGCTDSILCTPPQHIGNWPAIWNIVVACGLHYSCGNGDQAQLPDDMHKLTPGAYHLPSMDNL